MNSLQSWQDQPPLDLAIVGAGVAGLAAAHRARQFGWRVGVVEAARAVGGKVRSERRDGYLVEHGPSCFDRSSKTIWQLLGELGLESEVITARQPAYRYIYRDRAARRLPEHVAGLLAGDYMSMAGKLRMLAEPLVLGDARPDDTVWSFACRRLGQEAAHYLVAPFVAALLAGDSRQLGARDTFPTLWQWERESGSMGLGAALALGAEALPRDDTALGRYTLRDGLGSLPKALAAALPELSVQLSAPVEHLQRRSDGVWQLVLHHAMADKYPPILAKRVILTTPAKTTAELLKTLAPLAAATLADVTSARVAVVHLGGPDPHRVAPQGMGVAMVPGEGLRTLGILLPSSLFAGRAPAGHWLHTGMVGGAGDPEAVDLPDETLISLVRRAQEQAFGLSGARELPVEFSAVMRWRDAIAQPRVGHSEAMQQVTATVARELPGLALAGSYMCSLGAEPAARAGLAAAESLFAARAEA